MKKIVFCSAVISLVICIISFSLYVLNPKGCFLSLGITFAAISFHVLARVLASYMAALFVRHTHARRLSLFHAEEQLYHMIQLKKFKAFVPTYDPSLFSFSIHTPQEVYYSMRRALYGHLFSIPLSFIPLLFIPIAGGALPFITTSFLAAAFDFIFVMVQRYNMSRLCRIILF